MPKSVIGAQLYTLRDHLKTPADIAKTCTRVRQMGYEAVQVSGLGPIEPTELAKILDGEGLTCAATHVTYEAMLETSQCVDYHRTLKCQYPAIGGHRPFHETPSAALYAQFAADYTKLAQALAKQGLEIGYHNHSHELARFGGQTGLEILIEKSAKPVWFEIDTYWIAHGGGDPAAWIEKVAGRIPCVHFKDMMITPKREQKMCEIGSGNLNWRRILKACEKAGTRWYLVERDSGDLDPFESLRVSLENMRAMGLH